MENKRTRQIEVSVIIPVYKPESFLWECLSTLDRQTLDHSRFEVLLILNGPREPYMSQIEDFLKEHPSLLCRLIYSEKNGVSLARNIGMDEAEGEYICFLDGDDLVTDNYLQALLAIATPDTMALANVCAFDDGEHTRLAVIARAVHDQHHASPLARQDGEHDDHNRNRDRRNHGDHGKAGAADDAHADRPEQEHQIHRILDGRAESHNRQRADHAERNHDVGLDREDDGRGNDRQRDQ